ncbi:hydrolase [Arhodomonas sp. AD133]|uniref:hydrolase n=1 Tax=Arhodomonas sp. AD133 TaxID=3415009 RepID=UPI003EBD3D64
MLMKSDESAVLVVDVQEKLVPAIHDHGNVLDSIEWLLGVAGVLSVPMVATEQYPHGLGYTVAQLATYLNEDAIAEKVAFSAMAEPQARELITDVDRRQVLVCGIEAHVCVLQTAVGLKEAGYEVFVVGDAVGSRNPGDREMALARLRGMGVEVVTREMAAFEWLQRAGTDEFREISRDFLR